MYEIKIYTEDIGHVAAIAAVSSPNFTIQYGRGYWEGSSENSVIITFITKDIDWVKSIANNIKRINNQDAVLVTWHKVEQELI